MKTIKFSPDKLLEKTQLIDNTEDLAKFFKQINKAAVIAVDVESAAFYKYYARINLIQIATDKHAAILDPQKITDFTPFKDFVAKSKAVWLVHGGEYDIAMLATDLSICIHNICDIKKAAELMGYDQLGLSALSERFLGFKLDKKLQRCDWSKRPLTDAMKRYAILDSICLVPIYKCIKDEIAKAGRTKWLKEESDKVAEKACNTQPQKPDPYAFLIKGSNRLGKRGLAILRSVWNFREDLAKKMDRAPFMILTNKDLLDIARQAPKSMAGLAAVTQVNEKFLKKHGAALQKAIKEGASASLTDLERPNGRYKPHEVPLTAWEGMLLASLKEIRVELANKLGISPGVLVSSQALYEIVREKPETLGELIQSEIVHEWQAREIAASMLPVLQQEPPASAKKKKRRTRRKEQGVGRRE
ncbi:MAG: hypothetical protein GX221_02720 [Candidatus Riflebacteria bacterium]|nr:hypothetical protein [Candidatus Riflebacteria bacterium]